MKSEKLETLIERNRAAGKPTVRLEKMLQRQLVREQSKDEIVAKTYASDGALARGIVDMRRKGYAVRDRTSTTRGIVGKKTYHSVLFEKVEQDD